MELNNKDIVSGALFIAIGLFFAVGSYLRLNMGSAFNMGPGYFPLVLGATLCGFGALTVVNGLRQAEPIEGGTRWRGGLLVIAGIVFFALTARGLGMGPALFGCSLAAGLAPDNVSFRFALLMAVILTAFCLSVFIYGLGLPYPVFGPWLRG